MDNKLNTLDNMREESFSLRPEQAEEAVEEYLENVSSEEVKALQEAFSDPKYYESFKIAITHTSLIVFIAAFKATQPEETVDFDQYIREYLFFARTDDKAIYNMRVFYLSNLNAEEMGIGSVPDTEELSEEKAKSLEKDVARARNEYDSLINKLRTSYEEKSIYLK